MHKKVPKRNVRNSKMTLNEKKMLLSENPEKNHFCPPKTFKEKGREQIKRILINK